MSATLGRASGADSDSAGYRGELPAFREPRHVSVINKRQWPGFLRNLPLGGKAGYASAHDPGCMHPLEPERPSRTDGLQFFKDAAGSWLAEAWWNERGEGPRVIRQPGGWLCMSRNLGCVTRSPQREIQRNRSFYVKARGVHDAAVRFDSRGPLVGPKRSSSSTALRDEDGTRIGRRNRRL